MQQVTALKTVDAERVQFPIPANVYAETVVSVKHYTDRLFSFRVTRPQAFRFRSGEFVMIGLPNAEKPVFRAYSIASPSWDDEIEFFSIKVPDGPLAWCAIPKPMRSSRMSSSPIPAATMPNSLMARNCSTSRPTTR